MSSSDSPIPMTQKAWIVERQGKPRDALAFRTDVPVPRPKRGHVLVRVHAAALNPVGWKVMTALPNILSKRPHPAEHDLAGVIVDANGTSFSNGDSVIGYIPVSLQFSTRQGALAQYATLPEDNVVLKPSKLSWEEAAALPLAGSTAVQALRLGGYDPLHALEDRSAPSSIEPQEGILINGGSTAVGFYAIQLAKALSLRVTATASARNEAFVRRVGADMFLDYTARPIAEQLCADPPEPRFGMVFDAAGSLDTALYAKSGTYVKKGAKYVTTGPWPDNYCGALAMVMRWTGVLLRPSWLGGVSTGWRFVHVVNRKQDTQLLCTLIERGALRPCVDSTHEYEAALNAYDKIMTGRAVGKVVVKIE